MDFLKLKDEEIKGVKRKKGFVFCLKMAGFALVGLFLIYIISVGSLRWINPPFTAFTLRADWKALDMPRYNLRDNWVAYANIPDNIKWAVIASEDQNFWQHSGLDTEAIKKALDEKEKGIRIRGASTITQQVAKNLYLSGKKNYFRKGTEAILALTIDFLWSKERVLEVYLNVAEFGPGIYGVGTAVPHFFNKELKALQPEEAARMAAVLPNPKRMRVEPATPFVEERKIWILQNMTNLSGVAYYTPPQKIEEREAEEAILQEFLGLRPKAARILLNDGPDYEEIPDTAAKEALIDTVKNEEIRDWIEDSLKTNLDSIKPEIDG